MHFIKLKLTNGGSVVSENFYWHSLQGEEYLPLHDMPKVSLTGSFAETDRTARTL